MQAFAAYSLFSQSILIVLLSSVLAVFAACAFTILLRFKPTGNEKMNAVSKEIRRITLRFFGKECVYLLLFLIVAAASIYLFLDTGWAGVEAGKWGVPWATGSYVLGFVVTLLGALVAVHTSLASMLRVTQAARTGFLLAFRIVLLSASTTGCFIAGLGLLGLAGLLFVLLEWGEVALGVSLHMLVAFAAGVSTVALFLRLAGGLFAKAADLGADIAGKAEAHMSDDDVRNPAVLADIAGDHLAGVMALVTNLLENFVLAIVAAMFLGVSADLGRLGSNIAVLYPLFIVALAIVTSILGLLVIRVKKGSENIFGPLRNGTVVALVLLVIGSFFVGRAFLPSSESLAVFIALVSGILSGTVIHLLAEHALAEGSKTVQKLAQTAQTGAATLILRGLFVGHITTFVPVLFVILAVIICYINAGFFGVAMGAVGMLSTLIMHVLLVSIGAVADSANGVAELSQLPKQVHARTNTLFAAGKTAAAVGSYVATAAGAWAALSLFFAFTKSAALTRLDILQPVTIIGLLLGAVLPFVLTALTMEAVSATATKLTEDIRKQFRDTKGLLQGTVPTDSSLLLKLLSTSAVLKSLPSMILAFVAAIIIGLLFGAQGLGGFLLGSLLSGFLLSSMMIMTGSALDHTKRSIEAGNVGMGSESHKASLLGDMLGDTLKDVSGPAVMNAVKLIAVTALLTGGLFSMAGVF